MAKKRNRDETPVHRSKRLKGDDERHIDLPPLPQEILDKIVADSIELPNQPHYGFYLTNAMDVMSKNPFLKVSETYRKTALDTIAFGCIWIEVVSSDDEYAKIYQLLKERSAPLSKYWQKQLPQDRPTISFHMGYPGTWNHSDQIVFPYSYYSFLTLITELKSKGPDMNVQIECRQIPRSLQSTMNNQILPLISTLRCMGSIRLSGVDLPDAVHEELLDQTFPGPEEIRKDAAFAIGESHRLRELGLFDEADLLPLAFGPVLMEYCSSGVPVPHPEEWAPALARPGWTEDQDASAQIETRRAILLNEVNAFAAFRRLKQVYPALIRSAAEWVQFSGTMDLQTRWVEEPMFTWYGVPDRERALWHFTAGAVCEDRAEGRMQQLYRLTGRDLDDFSLDEAIIEATSDASPIWQDALTHFACAFKLDPDNENYRKCMADCQSIIRTCFYEDALASEVLRHPYTDISGQERVWVGLEETLDEWGIENLMYLPRAQRLCYEKRALPWDKDGDKLAAVTGMARPPRVYGSAT